MWVTGPECSTDSEVNQRLSRTMEPWGEQQITLDPHGKLTAQITLDPHGNRAARRGGGWERREYECRAQETGEQKPRSKVDEGEWWGHSSEENSKAIETRCMCGKEERRGRERKRGESTRHAERLPWVPE